MKTLISALALLLFLSTASFARRSSAEIKTRVRKNFHTVSGRSVSVAGRRMTVSELTKNLEYAFSKATIRVSYYDKLDQLAKLIIEKKYALALRGYADSLGSYKANWVLSDKRAKEVKTYLVSKGVPDNLIVATPFGSTRPVATNKTAEGRQKNRRVEIKINELTD